MDPNIVNHRFGPPLPRLDHPRICGIRTNAKLVMKIAEGQHGDSWIAKTVKAGKTTLATK
jgi:hypothetical protein